MIQKQIDRLKFTFSKGNKPNATDFEALNGIIEYVNQEQERQIQNNELFAKLFISDYKNEIIKSEGNYHLFVDSLRMVFRKGLNEHYEDFYNEVNDIEFIKFAKSKGLKFKLPYLCDAEETEIQAKAIKEHQKELIEHLNHFEKEKVFNRLNELLNKLIEDN